MRTILGVLAAAATIGVAAAVWSGRIPRERSGWVKVSLGALGGAVVAAPRDEAAGVVALFVYLGAGIAAGLGFARSASGPPAEPSPPAPPPPERGPGRYDVTLRLADGSDWTCTAVTLVDADAAIRIATGRYEYLDGSVAIEGATASYVGPLRYSENGTYFIGDDAFDRMEF